LAPNDETLAEYTFNKSCRKICAAFRVHPARQLLCMVGGILEEEETVFALLDGQKIRKQFRYRALSLPRIFSTLKRHEGRRFDGFIDAIVGSAGDRALYEDHIDERDKKAASDAMAKCVKGLSGDHVPADVSRFVDWMRDAFCQGLQTEVQIEEYFRRRKREDDKRLLEREKECR
jgi:hypothetical protein